MRIDWYIKVFIALGTSYETKSLVLNATDPIAPPRCLSALGMQNGLIPDKHITASSNLNTAANGRLYFKAGNGRKGGWTSLRNDDKQFFQVEFANVVNITGIATQGREDDDQWVISYTLSYSFDKINFIPYGSNGNVKVKNEKNNMLSSKARQHTILTITLLAASIRRSKS